MADINPEDYWYACSETDREELAKIAFDEGYISNSIVKTLSTFSPGSYLEEEIVRLFNAIWDSKRFIEQKHIDEMFKSLREQRVL